MHDNSHIFLYRIGNRGFSEPLSFRFTDKLHRSNPAITLTSLQETRSESTYQMAFAWRTVFTYNKYASICATTVRKSLKEQARLAAEKRGEMEIKVAKWDAGKQGTYENVSSAIEK